MQILIFKLNFGSLALILIAALIFGSSIEAATITAPSKGRAVIDEIVSLPDDATIPVDIYKKYDSRSIAESVVWRIYAKREKPWVEYYSAEMTPIDFDYFKDTSIQLIFDSRDLDSILVNGFQNQHQSLKSSPGATFNPQKRADWEDDLIINLKPEVHYQTGPENPANHLRPKYAVVDIEASEDFGVYTRPGDWTANLYGDITAVLKDEVKLRSLWTATDSYLWVGLPRHYWTFFKVTDPLSDLEKRRNLQGPYFEAQVLGELDIRDVKRWLIKPGTLASTITKLKRTGLPIFTYKDFKDHGRWRRVSDGEIFHGDAHEFDRLQRTFNRQQGDVAPIQSCVELLKSVQSR